MTDQVHAIMHAVGSLTPKCFAKLGILGQILGLGTGVEIEDLELLDDELQIVHGQFQGTARLTFSSLIDGERTSDSKDFVLHGIVRRGDAAVTKAHPLLQPAVSAF